MKHYPKQLAILSALCIYLVLFQTAQAKTFLSSATDSSSMKFESTAKLEFIDGTTSTVSARINCNLDSLQRGVSGFVVVDLRTIKTGLPVRDDHMRERHLQTDSYPFARFAIGEISGLPQSLQEDTSYACKINGTMTLHGRTQNISATASVVRSIDENEDAKEDSREESKEQLQVSANFQIALADYSIPRPEILFLKLAKVLEINLELRLAAPLDKPDGSMTSR